ncbi:hypothetical protein [Actinomyces howellii]|uniref:Uncharacterized protein n=1 Tax=Actinomyces howellii TaxID=52771 RepID=A0A448HGL9_9ACTO|nr:hypothetical protein [Actinomyces howellii]VEG28010.1 Uncharacterised protein [Actinomyces howellii]
MEKSSTVSRGRHVAPAPDGGHLWLVAGLRGPELWRPARLLALVVTVVAAVVALAVETVLAWRTGHTTGLLLVGAALVAASLVQALTGAEGVAE